MTRFQQYIVAVAIASAVGILVAVILHGRAAAERQGLHEVQCIVNGQSVPFMEGPGLVPAADLCRGGHVEP